MISPPHKSEAEKEITLDEVYQYLKERKNNPVLEAFYIHKTLHAPSLPKEIETYLKQKKSELVPEIQKKYAEDIKKERYREAFDKELNTGISINKENLMALVKLADRYESEGKIKDSKEILENIGHKHVKMLRLIMKSEKGR